MPVTDQRIIHAAPESGVNRESILESYIRTNPSFICPWGREALRAGRILFAAYPESEAAEIRVASLVAALDRLMNDRMSAIVWPRSSAPTHAMAYDQAWKFYVDFKIACTEMSSGACARSERERIELEAAFYRETGDWREYFSTGAPSLCSEPLHMISINHLYDRQHPLYAPVYAHVVTRQSDLLQVRIGAKRDRSKRDRWKRFVSDFAHRGSTPFVQGLPYYLPGDPRMDHPQARRSSGTGEGGSPGAAAGCPFHADRESHWG